MLFGAHVSIAGGIAEAPARAAAIGCEVFQIFSRSPRGGPAPVLTPEIITAFQRAVSDHHQAAWYIHTPYYINLASANAAMRQASVRIIREELERGSAIGAAAVMTHLGSAKEVGEVKGRELVVQSLKAILKGYKGACRFLIELSAGAGAVVGDTFEEIAEIIERSGHDDIGVCYDTQHAFASGYDIRTPAAVKKTFDQFDKILGIERIVMMHLNDSKVEFGAHRDRHEHVGDGQIGVPGFTALFGDRRLKNCHFILETEPDGQAKDIQTLKQIRKTLT